MLSRIAITSGIKHLNFLFFWGEDGLGSHIHAVQTES